MAQEQLPHEKTPVTRQQMADAMYTAWVRYFGTTPSKPTIQVLMAQWALETGEGKSMHNFNVGNVKSRDGDGHNFTYFACWERLSKASAEAMQAADPGRVKITRYYSDGKCKVWFYPEHPACRFRAFKTLERGLIDHLAILSNHKAFKKAWPAVRAGDPKLYAKLLKEARYYTAPLHDYTKGVLFWFQVYNSIELPEAPMMSKEEQEQIKGWISRSLQRVSSAGRTEEE